MLWISHYRKSNKIYTKSNKFRSLSVAIKLELTSENIPFNKNYSASWDNPPASLYEMEMQLRDLWGTGHNMAFSAHIVQLGSTLKTHLSDKNTLQNAKTDLIASYRGC